MTTTQPLKMPLKKETHGAIRKATFFAALLLSAANSPAANIQSSVWRDTNGDGVRNTGEPAVANAVMRLYQDYNGDGIAERMIEEASTDASGAYQFTGLTSGRYSVGIDLLSLPEDIYEITTANQGSSESADSDLNPNTCRTLEVDITAGQTLTDQAGAGLLQGDGTVRYWGQFSGDDLYTYQDHYLRTDHQPLPAGFTTHLELISIWIKWYANSSRRQQMLVKNEKWLERQRAPFSGGGLFPEKEYRGVISGAGEGSTGYQDGRGYWTGGASITKLYESPTDIGAHQIVIYEGCRGTVEPIKWKTVSTDELLYPWLFSGLETWQVTGDTSPPNTPSGNLELQDNLDVLDSWERRVDQSSGTAETFPRRYGLLQATNLVDVSYVPAGGGSPQIERIRHSTLQNAILQKVAIDLGYEKFVEAFDNLTRAQFWPSSVDEGMINFKKSVLSAVAGTAFEAEYVQKFDGIWGYPLPDTYSIPAGVSTNSGPFVNQTIYRWDFTSVNDLDIRPGFTALNNKTDQGFARFTSPLNEIGTVDVNEREITLGRGVNYVNDAYSNILASRGLSFAQTIQNGFWSIAIDTADSIAAFEIEGQNFGEIDGPSGGGKGYARVTSNYVVEVTDGELNINFPADTNGLYYVGGLVLRNLGTSYTPSTSVTGAENLDFYSFDFGGDNLIIEPTSGTIPVIPSSTNPNALLSWSDATASRKGVELSGAYHPSDLEGVAKTGITFEEIADVNLNVKVKTGLWRVELSASNLSSDGALTVSAEGLTFPTVGIGNQSNATIVDYVAVADGSLNLEFNFDQSRLVLTGLELTFISPDPTRNGTTFPDLNNTLSTTAENPWFTTTSIGPAWKLRNFGGVDVYTADEAFPAPNNDYYQLETTIENLTPGEPYLINLRYASDSNWAIKAGLSPNSLQGFSNRAFTFGGDDYVGTESALVKPLGQVNTDINTFQAALGEAIADVNGKIKVYIDDPNNAGMNSDQQRAWYLGLSYEAANFQPIPGLRFLHPTPKNGSILDTGDDVMVDLTADIPLQKVDLFRDGILVRQVTEAPFTWNTADQNDALLSNLQPGTYTYTAFVTGSNNATQAVSFGINVGGTFRWDAGSENSPLQPGYSRLTETTTDGLCFWENPTGLQTRLRGSGGDLYSDFILARDSYRLQHFLPNGNYTVTSNHWDADFLHQDMKMTAEGNIVFSGLSVGNSSTNPAQVYNVTVTDGVLNLEIAEEAAAPEFWILNRIDIEATNTVDAPTIETGTSTIPNGGNATLAYNLNADGGEANQVTLFYGTSDQGFDPLRWEHSVDLGDQTTGSSSTTINGLAGSQTYFYTFRSENSAGISWGEIHPIGPAPELIFIDATASNTEAVDGTAPWNGIGATPPQWRDRNDAFGVYSADEVAAADHLMLKTTIAGLPPGNTYEIFINYASQGGWAILAGLNPSALQGFSRTNQTINATNYLGESSSLVEATGEQKGVPGNFIPVYRGSLGQVVANASGEIEVYIDDPDNTGITPIDRHRAWYDGISYQLVSGVQYDNYATWAATNGASENPTDDSNQNGTLNGLEYFMGGTQTAPITFPSLVETSAGWTLTIPYNPQALASWNFQISADLSLWIDQQPSDSTVEILNASSEIRLTLPPSDSMRLFGRLKIVIP